MENVRNDPVRLFSEICVSGLLVDLASSFPHPKRFKLRQQHIRSCAAEPVAPEPKNPMVLCTFRLWSLAAPADRPGCRLSESVQVMPWTPQGVRTPSKRYAPGVLSPHLGF